MKKPFVGYDIGTVDYVLHLASNAHPMVYSADNYNKEEYMKRIIYSFLVLLSIMFIALVIGTITMIGLYAIPTKHAKEHIQESTSLYGGGINQTGNWTGTSVQGALSNYTDSIMLNNAIFRPYDSVVKNAMLNSHAEYKNAEMTENLVRYVNGDTEYTIKSYGRYWHGYLAFVIIGLQVFNVGELKVVLMILQSFLLFWVLFLLSKKSISLAVCFLFVVNFLNQVTTALTFQESDIYCIMLISMIVILKMDRKLIEKDRFLYFFCINGCIVAFIDFLTYPLVALMIPIITLLMLNNSLTFKKGMTILFSGSLSWGIGYAGMWIGKWIVGSFLTGQNIISEGIHNVTYRISGDGSLDYDIIEGTFSFAMKRIIDSIKDRSFALFFIVFLGFILFLIIKGIIAHSIVMKKTYFIYGIGFASPFLWFFIVRNHTAIHPWITYRNLSICIWSISIIVYLITHIDKSC